MGAQAIRVSQVNAYIKRVLQSDPVLGAISIVGEISNLKFHSSGHVYFSLKDNASKLNCFLPENIFEKIRYELADGIEIVATGYISVFEKNGTYSLSVRSISVEGAGGLAAEFEKLKAKLASEGLFDEKHKKGIPVLAQRIAVVTSPTGAVLHDIIKIAMSMASCLDILICPVKVQGIGAAEEIAEGIDMLNRVHPDIDCMIVGRGGGSAEELWAFNEEIVARSIFASKIPVISAVGHETDFTISDFVADCRAETPSAAAKIAVADTLSLMGHIDNARAALSEKIARMVERLSLRVQCNNAESLNRMALYRLHEMQWRLKGLNSDMAHAAGSALDAKKRTMDALAANLAPLNPKAVLKRGYAILENRAGKVVSSVRDIADGETLTAVLHDGSAELTARRP
ncbi:MAG: exodeoxyribonuclease VII large subunit [Clostridiales Family XIII bacterium]|jgi:exodeoxyribonuclease VII large subunit|nr:exodeoxyribonuclease VII large subunit [Clostridiales Family XIII bacterium]